MDIIQKNLNSINFCEIGFQTDIFSTQNTWIRRNCSSYKYEVCLAWVLLLC